MMRTISSRLTPVDRQVTESINILEAAKKEEESLNLKPEWGGAKIPSILVHSPRGIAKQGVSSEEEV